MKRAVGAAAAAGYVATIFLANWAINRYGAVRVAPGLMAPAGVYFVGAAFTLRDITQELLGRVIVLAAIVAGALCSAFVSPSLAFASGVAFLVSESADFAIYTPLRESNWIGAVVASNVVGVLVDSWLFLTLAFHSLHFFWGQVVGKLWVTALAVVILAPVRKPFLRWARAGAPSAATLLGREVTPTA